MRKQLYLCAALIAASLTTFAQEKKNYVLGGIAAVNESVESPPDDAYDAKGFSFTIGYARYLTEKLSLGLKASLNRNSREYESPDADDYTIWNTGITPFVRYEYPLWKSSFALYSEGGLTVGFGNSVADDRGDIRSFRASAYYEPGILFRASKCVALQASFGSLLYAGYSQEKFADTDTKTSLTTAGIASGYGLSNIQFTFNYLF